MKRWPRGQGLSAAALKGVAICSMLLDHALKTLWWDAPTVLYVLGRLAFPLYAFLLVQGAKHTHHMGKYALRLAVFALLSEVPFDLCLYEQPFYWFSQNVFWTLLLGLLAIWAYEQSDRRGALWLGVVAMIAALRLGDVLNTDYGSRGVGCILFMYFAGKSSHKGLQLTLCGLGIAWTGAFSLLFAGSMLQMCALLALIPIGLYNGQKGRQGPKILWYGFYPLHLLILWLLQMGQLWR
jgi:hypothetical protein